MGVRLRDEAVLLEPAMATDRETQEQTPSWKLDPASATPTPFQCQPLNSTEEQLTAETIITRWHGFLPGKWAGIVDSTYRVLWDDEVYSIDGDVELHKRGKAVRFLTVTLKKVKG